MKTNFLAKHKWWVLAIVLMIALMAVSVSYSAWDTLSFKAMMNAKGGDFKEKAVWSDYIKLVDDRYPVDAPNKQIDVGDIVTYGNFYQKNGATTTEPQRWIVVNYDSSTKVATLLTEKVVVYGNYWGQGSQYLNDYYRSTVRSWLNSGRSSVGSPGVNDNTKNDNVRNDNVGSAFSGTASQVNKGFLDVAFNDAEKKLLVPKSITGMKYLNTSNQPINSTTTPASGSRTLINDLVWLPSWQEMYGEINTPWGEPIDNLPSIQKFSYFSSDTERIVGATDYAWNAGLSSYYNNGGGGTDAIQSAARWWLRSPCPSSYYFAIVVHNSNSNGTASYGHTSAVTGGVRPAVCVQL